MTKNNVQGIEIEPGFILLINQNETPDLIRCVKEVDCSLHSNSFLFTTKRQAIFQSRPIRCRCSR